MRLFIAVQTQWRLAPTGSVVGLDYAAVRAAARAIGVKWRKVFPSVRVMELETLTALREEPPPG